MHFFTSLSLVCSLVASVLCAGYAPVPGVAPAPTSYGNPYYTQQLQNAQPFQTIQNAQPFQTLQNTQPVYLGQPVNTFNTVPQSVLSSGNVIAPPAPSGAVVGNNHVAALTSEDDWDNIITARGVKNQKIGKKFRRAH